MTPADLIATLRTDIDSYTEAELADVANYFSLIFGQRYVQTPAEAARALVGGLPPALAALSPEARASAKHTLLAALAVTDGEATHG